MAKVPKCPIKAPNNEHNAAHSDCLIALSAQSTQFQRTELRRFVADKPLGFSDVQLARGVPFRMRPNETTASRQKCMQRVCCTRRVRRKCVRSSGTYCCFCWLFHLFCVDKCGAKCVRLLLAYFVRPPLALMHFNEWFARSHVARTIRGTGPQIMRT